MGKRGPKKEPVELKQLKGTRKKSRDPDPVATKYGIPPNPYDPKKSKAEHEAWLDVVQSMVTSGIVQILTASDFVAVERCAVALCRARQWTAEAEKVIAAGERYVTTRANGLMPHPALREERLARAELAKAASALGMSPSDRASLSAAPRREDGDAPASSDAVLERMLSIGPQPVDG